MGRRAVKTAPGGRWQATKFTCVAEGKVQAIDGWFLESSGGAR
jgi:hypothetical protein